MALSIVITERASEKVFAFMEQQGKKGWGLRVRVAGGGCSGLQYQLELEDAAKPGDKVIDAGTLKIFVDLKSALYLAGAEIDYVEEMMASGFKITNPNARSTCGCGQSFH